MSDVNDFPELRFEGRFRNGVLWHLIFDTYRNVHRCSLATGFSEIQLGKYLNLKQSPFCRKGGGYEGGEYKPTCVKIANYFHMLVEDVFPPRLYREGQVVEIEVERELSFEGLPTNIPNILIEDGTRRAEVIKAVREALDTLAIREREIIKKRYGWYGHKKSLSELGKEYNVTKERIRQIETRALRNLRKPKRNRILKEFMGIR